MDEMILKDNFVVIDVREPQRFKGETEPIDLVAGHIPGAINIPFTTNLDENGFILSPEELKVNYQKVFENIDSDNRVVHCGSGVTACHTLLAIAVAGLSLPKLYVGSWSEWSRNNREIVVEQ
jgi:thiosulfate/3-mercaptopyruvate sulfurtransferase